jgi:DNA-binding CsgD family transcriptional regulator/GAF domain-containing protein
LPITTQEAEANGSPVPSLDQRVALRADRAEVRGAIAEHGDDGEALAVLAELDQAIIMLDHRLHAEQVENLVKVHEGMAHLRACETTAGLICAAPRQLCDSCGFTRAMISRVDGSVWVPAVLEVKAGIDPLEAEFRSYVEGARIRLVHTLLETEMLRRRVGALVSDPINDPRTFHKMVEVSRSTSFVAAPIMSAGRVIGFLHADRFGESEPVTTTDRDMLWVFVEHFGLLFERAILMERLAEQRSRLSEALASAAGGIDGLYSEELELIRRGAPTPPARHSRRRTASKVDALLTPRECEILELLATGATNAAIARELVVGEATVKSHMKRIYRKLHVNTRAEALATFLRLVALDERVQ